MPSLNALRAFEAVVRRGSVADAANALHVTPGAVSKQIRSLEAQMGIVLLVRDGRGVHPTRAGVRLQYGLASAFAEIAGCVDRVTNERSARPDQDLRCADVRVDLADSAHRPLWRSQSGDRHRHQGCVVMCRNGSARCRSNHRLRATQWRQRSCHREADRRRYLSGVQRGAWPADRGKRLPRGNHVVAPPGYAAHRELAGLGRVSARRQASKTSTPTRASTSPQL